MPDVFSFWVVVGLLLQVLILLLLVWLLFRRPPADPAEQAHRLQLLATLQNQTQRVERIEGELRREISDNARGGRLEIQQTLATFQESLTQQGSEATRTQNAQLDAFAQQLLQLRGTLGDTLTQQLQAISLGMTQQAAEATRTQNAQIDAFAQQLTQLRVTLANCAARWSAACSSCRPATRPSSTRCAPPWTRSCSHAGARLGESFKQVAERLEQVHKGLGEMQTLAQGVGDLKHVLSNVKTRGMFGEVQLGALLEQVFAPDQYASAGGHPAGQPRTWSSSPSACRAHDDGAPVLAADRRQVPARGLRAPARRAAARRRRGRRLAARALERRIR
jgi:DNA recombination protein RmuC